MQKTGEPIETVNVFLGRKDGEELMKEASVPERYIISQNTQLLDENKALAVEKSELMTRIEELEGIEDRADIRSLHLKGLLKNFHEVSKWQEQIDKKQRLIILATNADMASFTRGLKSNARVLDVALIVFALSCINLFGILPSSLVVTCVIIVVSFQEYYTMDIPVYSYDGLDLQIKELREQVEKADKANDYIHEYLDSQ